MNITSHRLVVTPVEGGYNSLDPKDYFTRLCPVLIVVYLTSQWAFTTT